MDRHAELQKLIAEATEQIALILQNAKAAGRDEDHLDDKECEQVEKLATSKEEYEAEKASIERRREALKRAKLDEAAAAPAAKPAGRAPQITGGPAFEADTTRWGWANYAQFLGAVRTAITTNGIAMDEKLRAKMAPSGMSRLSGPDGGFATPPAFETAIWDGVMEKSEVNLISMCDQRTITNKSLTLNALDETSEADGSRNGGVLAYWVAEGGSTTATKPKLRQIEIAPKKLFALYYATDEVLEDANALPQEVEKLVSREIRYVANRAIVRGSGAGQPKGILQGTAGTDSPRVKIAVETGQTTATPLVTENIDKMWSRLDGDSRGNSVWLINQELEPYLQGIGRDVGTGGFPAYMPPGGLSSSPYATLKGRPVVPCKWCSAANTEGDIILADMRGYLVGVRGGVRAESSIHVNFLTDETAFRFIFRIDGQPWRLKPVTREFGTSFTVSEFVTLATRS